LEIKPDHPDTLNNLAEALKDGGQTEEAVAMIQKAQELKPSTKRRFALATVLPAIGRSVEELARWRGRTVDQLSAMIEEGVQLDPARDVVPALFYLAYQGMNDRPIQEMVTRLYAQETELLKPRSPGDRDPSDKIRVGFISKYFRNHTIGKLSQGLIAQLSRRTFDVTVFSLEAHDDANARHIQRHADRYLVVPDDVGKARQIVADARLDVLLYTDVGMDPMTSALARARLAPVQCVTWGHPVTTGIPQIDYFLSSNLLEPPGAEEHYTERLVRLDTLPVYFHRPVLSSPPRARADFGLSDSSHVYLCPQSLFKFHPDFDGPMAQILRRDSRGEVVLIEGAFPHWKELLMDRFRAAIPDVADRIRFVPHQKLDDFLHLVALADVVLDPFHFGGGSSTYETFALGTPIVTWPSEFMRGRAAYACYRKMGLPDCVASDADDYVDRAVRLGTDRAYRDRIRAKILAAAAVLFEDQEAVRQIERFFLQAVQDLRDAGRPLHDEHGPHPHWPQRRPGVSLPSDRWECP
jgi:predicted O-linked N-acetylglucosamine transferase (SPINDLY family)